MVGGSASVPGRRTSGSEFQVANPMVLAREAKAKAAKAAKAKVFRLTDDEPVGPPQGRGPGPSPGAGAGVGVGVVDGTEGAKPPPPSPHGSLPVAMKAVHKSRADLLSRAHKSTIRLAPLKIPDGVPDAAVDGAEDAVESGAGASVDTLPS